MKTEPPRRDLTELGASEIAERIGGVLVGNGDATVDGVQSLKDAEDRDAAFLGNPKYASQVRESRASVILVPDDFPGEPPAGRAWIRCGDPSAAFSVLVDAFAPPPVEFPPGRHAGAVIATDATVAESASIGPHAVIEPGAVIGRNTVIGANAYVGHAAVIGDDCRIFPLVTVRERCILGNRVIVHSGTVIGSDGFGYTSGEQGHEKVPQTGIVRIEDDVEIGANAAIDRARFGVTWIKRGTKIDNLVQVAHNVVVGEHCILVSQSGIAGSSELGNGVVLAGQAGVSGHVHLGDGAMVVGQSGVSKDVPAGAVVMGSPAVDRKEHVRDLLSVRALPEMKKRLRELARQVDALRARLDAATPSDS